MGGEPKNKRMRDLLRVSWESIEETRLDPCLLTSSLWHHFAVQCNELRKFIGIKTAFLIHVIP